MATVTFTEPAATLEQLRAQLAELSRRLDALERRDSGPMQPAVPPPAAAPAPMPQPEGITEEELLAISAVIGAYLGVRPHIRQIRLVGTTAWAQEGRVSIQASHRLS